jgi:type IV pilus assembly protein PilM
MHADLRRPTGRVVQAKESFMAAAKSVWGIDIGQCALKALKLRSINGATRVEAFDIIEHPRILSQAEGDRDQLIRNALEQFLARNNVVGSQIVVSVPGQSSFSRFIKLPPVETKKIPDIVRFEAEQQIPFPMDDVVWRWQTFHDPDSPDVEVGIFAMKRQDVASNLSYFSEVELDIDAVQMAPLALYNFMRYDEQTASDGATLLIDVGADKTDLVVSDGPRIWTRTVKIGGNDFTEALVKAFKLSFAKAEKLKRTAASSKYARQVFQTMRPVFSDLVQEIQRSIGFYTSLHRESRFTRVLGLGNGFRLPGLQKFLEQNLNVSVHRIDSFQQVSASDAVNAPVFQENVLSFAVAYGLGVQGLGEASIETNLLPRSVSTQRMWAAKRPWFAAAAAMIVIALSMMLYSSYRDLGKLKDDRQTLAQTREVVSDLQQLQRNYRNLGQAVGDGEEKVKSRLKLFGYRNFWPSVQKLISRSMMSVAEHQGLYNQALTTPDPERRKQLLAKLEDIPREQRSLLFLEQMGTEYVPDISAVKGSLYNRISAQLGVADRRGDAGSGGAPEEPQTTSGQAKRGFLVWVICRTTLEERQIRSQLITRMRRFGKRYAEQRLGAVTVEADEGEFVAGASVSPTGPTSPIPTVRPPRGGSRVPYGGEDEGRRRPPSTIGREDRPAGGGAGSTAASAEDPVFKGESLAGDARVGMIWLVSVNDDGLELEPIEQADSQEGR